MSDVLVLWTFLHVLLSVVGIASGTVVALGFLRGRHFEFLTSLFLAATLATSLTGFLFPFDRLMPSHVVGVASIVVLAGAYATRSGTARRVRRIFVACATAALYLNMVVLVAQAFMKIPALRALAPTQMEWPLLFSQGILLFAFVGLTAGCMRREGMRAGAKKKKGSADAPVR